MKRARYWLADAFPPPTGPYGIGNRLLAPARPQAAAARAQIRLFYPLDPCSAAAAPRHPPRFARRPPSRHPDVSVEGAPAAAGRFPLVLYFSGWPGSAIDNYSLIGELVSHGLEVAAVIYPSAAGDMDYSSAAAYSNTVAEANRLVRLRAHDAIALLDQQRSSRAALLGFSFGGAVAAEAALLDERFCAAVNIDGRPWGRALHEGVACPYLFVGGDRPMPSTADLTSSNSDRRFNAQLDVVDIEESARNMRQHGGIHVTVSRVDHLDFIDGALRWSRRRFLRRNPVDPRWVLGVTRAYVSAFLRHAFGLLNSPLPDAAGDGMAGVTVDVHPAPEPGSARREACNEAARETRQQ